MKNILKTENSSAFDREDFLAFDSLPIGQIAKIANGDDVTHSGLDDFIINDFDQPKSYKILMTGIHAKMIKSAEKVEETYYASPIECCRYLKEKRFPLPEWLAECIPDAKRSKESYRPQEERGNEKALIAVLQTLLDLWPEYPKDLLVELLPVREYANGKAHDSDHIKNLITRIEGKTRRPGAINKDRKSAIQKEIPSHWIP